MTIQLLPANIRQHALVYLGLLICVGIVFGAVRYLADKGYTPAPKAKSILVKKQSFSLQVTERGIVSPARIIPIKSAISGNQAKMIWLLDEGTQINKGLLVARFDTKPLMDALQKTKQQYADAKAQFDLSVREQQLILEAEKSKEESADRELKIARIKANDLKNGSGPLKRQQIEQKVKQAERLYHYTTKERDDMQVLLEKEHISNREYEKIEDELLSIAEILEVNQAELKNFKTYEWPRILREAELIEDAAATKLSRVKRTSELNLQQHQSKIEKYRRDLAVKEKEVKKVSKEVAACDIYSPADGILLYSEIPRAGKKGKIQIGDSIWHGQTFLEVPDTSDLVVEINVREIDVAKLQTGMSVAIQLDAFPDRVFSGVLINIDALAQEDSNSKGVRRFFAKIKIQEPATDILVGMSATVSILYKQMNNILAVPASAVFYIEGKSFVIKKQGDIDVQTEVTIAESGIKWIEIVKGLNENDRILSESF